LALFVAKLRRRSPRVRVRVRVNPFTVKLGPVHIHLGAQRVEVFVNEHRDVGLKGETREG